MTEPRTSDRGHGVCASCTPGRWLRCALLATCAFALPREVMAQVVSGRVVEAESGRPVPLAYVGLLAPGRRLVVASLGRADGAFSLRAPSAGSYFLYVEREGYGSVLDGLYELGEDGVLEVTVGLSVAPVPLDPVVVDVEAPRRDLRTVGYFERRALGLGHFLDRASIEARALEHLTDAMRGTPGLIVTTPMPNPLVPTGVLNPEVRVRMGTGACAPSLYVDGHLVAPGGRGAVRPDDFVDPYDVEAVELYTSPAEVPPSYETASGCGVMLVWTR